MARIKALTSAELTRALRRKSLAGWTVADGKLQRSYEFADFVHAFGFMAAAAVAIEAMNHHPNWSNVWNKVAIELWTHDAGGLTARDLELAEKLEALARKLL